MSMERIKQMSFRQLYPNYVNKAKSKNRTELEVIEIICWLTGYKRDTFLELIKTDLTVEDFFLNAPKYNPSSVLITGRVCGVTIETITDPFTKKVRQLDKLIDELAKGRLIERILRKA